MNGSSWQIIDGNGVEMGPYSVEDLQRFHQSGIISGETLVWTEGWDQWFPAAQVQGLLPIPTSVAVEPKASALQLDLAAQLGLEPARSGPGPKASIPTWLSIVTALIGAGALILFFFPWVSTITSEGYGQQKKTTEPHSQTGFQSLIPTFKVSDEMLADLRSAGGTDEMAREIEERAKEGKFGPDSEPISKATLIFVALIVVGIGFLLALIGLANQMPALAAGAQVCYAVGAILLGVQMGKQFPIVVSYVKEMNAIFDAEVSAIAHSVDQNKEAESENKEAEGESEPAEGENKRADVPPSELIKELKQGANLDFGGKFQPTVFIVVGILGSSILLIVITMTLMNNSTMTVPVPGSGASEQRPPGGFRLQ